MAGTAVGRLKASLGLDTSDFDRRWNRKRAEVRQGAAEMERSFAAHFARSTGLARAMIGGFLGGAAFAAVSQATDRVRSLANEVATIGDEARRAGLSAKAFQEWKFVAEQNRIGVDALVDGFKELSLRADEFILTGQGSAAEAFQRLGFGATELKERLKDPSALMLEIIGRLQQLDKASQIRIADELFGGSGGERFVELLAQGEAGIRRTIDTAHDLGVVIDDELIAKAAEVDRQFNIVASTVGTALKSAIVSAAASLADFIEGFRSFEARSDGALERRHSDLMRRRVEIHEGRKAGRWDILGLREGGEDAELEAIEREEALIIAERDRRSQRDREAGLWKPKADAWVAPTSTGAIVPDKKKSEGKGRGKESRPDEYQRAAAGLREQTTALREQAQAYDEVEASGRDYADAVAYAKARADLLTAAQEAGLAITPALKAEIEQLADQYTRAGEAAEAASDRLEQIRENAKTGAGAITSIFMALTQGSASAKQAIAGLLLQMAEVQAMRAFLGLGGGMGAGIIGTLGSLLTVPGHANGTRDFAGGLTWVGERGRELVALPSGSQIYPHEVSERLAGQGGQPGTLNVNISGASGDQHIVDLVQQGVTAGLRSYDRTLPDRISQINSRPRFR